MKQIQIRQGNDQPLTLALTTITGEVVDLRGVQNLSVTLQHNDCGGAFTPPYTISEEGAITLEFNAPEQKLGDYHLRIEGDLPDDSFADGAQHIAYQMDYAVRIVPTGTPLAPNPYQPLSGILTALTRGERGERGEQGLQGEKGEPGESGASLKFPNGTILNAMDYLFKIDVTPYDEWYEADEPLAWHNKLFKHKLAIAKWFERMRRIFGEDYRKRSFSVDIKTLYDMVKGDVETVDNAETARRYVLKYVFLLDESKIEEFISGGEEDGKILEASLAELRDKIATPTELPFERVYEFFMGVVDSRLFLEDLSSLIIGNHTPLPNLQS